jgi:hypothetical protein
MKAKYEQSVATGKCKKMAGKAIMRKLIVMANAQLWDQKKWAQNPAWSIWILMDASMCCPLPDRALQMLKKRAVHERIRQPLRLVETFFKALKTERIWRSRWVKRCHLQGAILICQQVL